MRPRQPFENPEPSGSAASWPAAPMASANAGARSSVSRPISPSTFFSSPSVSASAAAQPRARYHAVQVVEGQPVARKRGARRQADISRQRIRCLEVQQRPEIDAANPEIEARLRLGRPRFSRAFRFGIEAGSRQLHFQPQRRTPHARHRAFELRRAIARRDRAIEPQRGQQWTALAGRQSAIRA